MNQIVKLKRTLTPDNEPTTLQDGEIALGLGDLPLRMWVGTPTGVKELIADGYLPLAGGTLTGDLTLDECALHLNAGFDWNTWEYTSYIELRSDWTLDRIQPGGAQALNVDTGLIGMGVVWDYSVFAVERWDDLGDYLGHVLTIRRDTGNTELSGALLLHKTTEAAPTYTARAQIIAQHEHGALWTLILGDETPLSGPGGGSAFRILRHSHDPGAAVLGTPLMIERMTGDVLVEKDPVQDMQVATKRWVEATAANYLPLAGGTLTGDVTMAGGFPGTTLNLRSDYDEVTWDVHWPLKIDASLGAWDLSSAWFRHDSIAVVDPADGSIPLAVSFNGAWFGVEIWDDAGNYQGAVLSVDRATHDTVIGSGGRLIIRKRNDGASRSTIVGRNEHGTAWSVDLGTETPASSANQGDFRINRHNSIGSAIVDTPLLIDGASGNVMIGPETAVLIDSGFDWGTWEYTSYLQVAVDWSLERYQPGAIMMLDPTSHDPLMSIGFNGTNIGIERWDDGGNYLGHAFTVWRDTGDATIQGGGRLVITKANDGASRSTVIGRNENGTAWSVDLGTETPASSAESGDFRINRHASVASAIVDTPLLIDGFNGRVSLAHDPVLPEDIATRRYVDAAVAPSDIRIKDVRRDYVHGLTEIETLHPIVYTFKGNDESHTDRETEHVGLIAQEVEEIMPELVKLTNGRIDGDAVTDLRVLDQKTITFALINAVKELSARVKQLEAASTRKRRKKASTPDA